MNIGELAKRTGLTRSRIRFYERIGLLKTAERRSNGYRAYSPETALTLQLITTAQQAGFSLDEIRTLLPPDLEHWEHDVLIETLQRKVRDIQVLEVRLARSKAKLVELIEEIEAKPDDVNCAANARRVLAHMLEEPGIAADDIE